MTSHSADLFMAGFAIAAWISIAVGPCPKALAWTATAMGAAYLAIAIWAI